MWLLYSLLLKGTHVAIQLLHQVQTQTRSPSCSSVSTLNISCSFLGYVRWHQQVTLSEKLLYRALVAPQSINVPYGPWSPLTSPGPLMLPSTHSAPQPSPFSSAPFQLLPLSCLPSHCLFCPRPTFTLISLLPTVISTKKSHPSFATHTINFLSFLICLLSSRPVE